MKIFDWLNSISSWKTQSDILVAWVTIFAFIGGGVFAIVQYLDAKRQARLENTMKYRTLYDSDRLATARIDMTNVWEKNLTLLNSTLHKEKSKKVDVTYSEAVVFIIDKNKLKDEILSMVGFFEEIAICIENRLCDKKVAEKIFFADAKAFFNRTSPYICELRVRLNDKRLGEKLETYFASRSLGSSCQKLTIAQDVAEETKLISRTER